MTNEYAQPDALVLTQWVADNLQTSNVRLVVSVEDLLLLGNCHLTGSLIFD